MVQPSTGTGDELVTVVIPCFNQAHFLPEAIESVHAQTHARVELVVVDDGSSDNTAAVVDRYPAARCLRQENQGLSGARNAGLREANGAHVVFLDADDLLLPNALADGVAALRDHPEAAFVFGHTQFLMEDDSAAPAPHRPRITGDPYAAVLEGCPIMPPAAVMFRRAIFEDLAPFSRSLPAAEDYELYYRIARHHPVHCHEQLVAIYRRHAASMTSGSVRLLLRSNLIALHRERRFVWRRPRYWSSYRVGARYWRLHYGTRLVAEVQADIGRREWARAVKGAATLARWWPRGLAAVLSSARWIGPLHEWAPGA
jgi:glycosyltransferase involved in cell wall biosynthesis